jgi:hypothetical protein
MLARYHAAGGRVRWETLTDAICSATFTHPSSGDIQISWDINRAKAADLTGKENWKRYPRQMLRARVISEGVRTSYPAVVCGIYTPEEVGDMAPEEQNGNGHRHEAKPAASPAPPAPQVAATTLQMKNGNVITIEMTSSAPTIDAAPEPTATTLPVEATTLPVDAQTHPEATEDAANLHSVILGDPLLSEMARFCSIEDGRDRLATEDERNGLFWLSEHPLCPATNGDGRPVRAHLAKASKNGNLGVTTARSLASRVLSMIEEANRG